MSAPRPKANSSPAESIGRRQAQHLIERSGFIAGTDLRDFCKQNRLALPTAEAPLPAHFGEADLVGIDDVVHAAAAAWPARRMANGTVQPFPRTCKRARPRASGLASSPRRDRRSVLQEPSGTPTAPRFNTAEHRPADRPPLDTRSERPTTAGQPVPDRLERP